MEITTHETTGWTHTSNLFTTSQRTLNSSNSRRFPEVRIYARTLSPPLGASSTIKSSGPSQSIYRIEKPSIDSTDKKSPVVLSITDAMREDDASANQPTNDQLQTGAPNLSTSSLTAYCPLPAKKRDARRLKQRSTHYAVMNGELHRWTATKVLHKCIHGEQTRLVMSETHEGAAGNHSGGRALALKSQEPRLLLANNEY